MMAIDPKLPLLFKLLWLLLTSLSLPFIPWTSPLKRPLKSWNSPLCLPCLQIFQLKHPRLQRTGYLFEKPSSRKLQVFPPALPPLLLTPFFYYYFLFFFTVWTLGCIISAASKLSRISVHMHSAACGFLSIYLLCSTAFLLHSSWGKNRAFSSKINK